MDRKTDRKRSNRALRWNERKSLKIDGKDVQEGRSGLPRIFELFELF